MHVTLIVIFSFIYIVFLVCAIATWNTVKTPNQNVLLGVTLPAWALDEPEVKQAKTRFPRLCLKWGMILTLTFLPIPILLIMLPNRIAVTAVYLMVWAVGFAMYCINRPYRVVRRYLLDVKREKGWHCGPVREVTVDTRASLLKNRSAMPAWLFLPAVILPAILFFTANEKLKSAVIIAVVTSIGLKGLFFWCYQTAKRLKTKVWSENSEINVAVNGERQRIWTQFWVVTAYWDSVSCVVEWTLFGLPESGINWFMVVIILSGFAELALIVFSNASVRRVQKNLEAINRKPILADDDDYWKDSWFAGAVYCNPDDHSTTVEKRLGIGTTMNLATPKGKAFCYGMLIFVVVLIAGLSGFLLMADFSSTALRIDSASHTVSIDTFLYGTKFDESSVKSVTLVNSIPKSFRTNGSDDGYSAIGHFDVDGYGPSLLYLHENQPPYLVIRLSDGYVFYNEPTKEQTMTVYEKLKKINS